MFLKNTQVGRAARAQHGKYATEIMLRQHRTHVFTFYISGCWVRVFYWDRNGCLASESINLNTDAAVLFQTFIYRLAKMDDTKLGYDNTVELATDEDINPLEEWNPSNKELQDHRDIILSNQELFPIYKVGHVGFSCDI